MAALASTHGEAEPAVEASPPAYDVRAVALHNAVHGCVLETFAAIVAAHQAEHGHDAEVRAVFSRIAADELNHAQLAWDLHAWLLSQLDAADRNAVLAAQCRALEELPARARTCSRATPAALGWPHPARAGKIVGHFADLVRRQPAGPESRA